MKKLLWIALFAATVLSCKDDDGNVNVSGTWLWVSEEYTNCDDPDDNESETDTDGCDDGNCTTFEFANGTYTITELDGGDTYTDTGTYKISGSKMTVDSVITVNVKRSGNTLTLTYKDEDDGCDIKITFTKVG